MHELLHFYTWEAFGREFKKKNVINERQYYDFKEALTEILNLEFADLMGGDYKDLGYPQHQEMRKRIKECWNKYKNLRKVVEKVLSCYYDASIPS